MTIREGRSGTHSSRKGQLWVELGRATRAGFNKASVHVYVRIIRVIIYSGRVCVWARGMINVCTHIIHAYVNV